MKKKFFYYVLPSMLAFAFSGLYSIVDGLFIGHSIGDSGLAAINFAYPLTMLIQASATAIGLGGAIGISICRGENDEVKKNNFLGTTMTLLIIACIFLTLVLTFFAKPLLILFGAEGIILTNAYEYIRFIILGASFQILANGFAPILRNYGKSLLAMSAMIMGFVTNIFLDWLFVIVLGYGMAGAAWATIIGQAVTVIPCLFFIVPMLKKLSVENYKPTMEITKGIIKTALSPFGLAMAPYIVILMMNKSTAIYGGDKAVSAYAVVSYVLSFIYLLLQGIGDGCQPLMSYYIGQDEPKKAKLVRNMAYKFAFFVSLLYIVVVVSLRFRIPKLFGNSDTVAAITSYILPIFSLSFIFYAFLRVTTSYFYATKNNIKAYILIYSEPAINFIILMVLLPKLIGLNGVWFAIPCSQLILFIMGLFLVQKDNSDTLTI